VNGPFVGLAPYGRCVSCGRFSYLDENDMTCLTACEVPPTVRAPAVAAPASCDCGAATADPVSTRRDGGGGHSGWCAVGGRP
jgi:hypothetical protein